MNMDWTEETTWEIWRRWEDTNEINLKETEYEVWTRIIRHRAETSGGLLW
jgi:hypothetical protein